MTRAELVRVANSAAAAIFVGKAKLSPKVIALAKSKAFDAIRRADHLTGTSGHPHAAYAHGISELAFEGVEQAKSDWARIKKHGVRTPAQLDAEIAAYCKASPITRSESEKQIHPEVFACKDRHGKILGTSRTVRGAMALAPDDKSYAIVRGEYTSDGSNHGVGGGKQWAVREYDASGGFRWYAS